MKKRILHVDDEERFTQLLKLRLEQTGQYEVRTVYNPVEAANVARESKPDLMLLDIIMPVMFGGDVANQFKADPELKNIRVVFLSASVNRRQVEEHHGIIGGYPFIAAPAPLNEVISRMESVLSGPWPVLPPPQLPA